MKRFCNYLMALLGLMMAISCEERLSTERIGSQSNGPSIKVRVPGTNALMTKATDASAVPTRVFGNEDDDFTITEYVYDMNAMGPMTKGREIVTSGTSGHPINQNGESFGVLAYYETDGTPTQPIAPKGLDIDGSCSYQTSSWSWDSSTKQHTTTYDSNGNLTNNGLAPITANGGVLAPCWRVNSTERIWSIYPLSAADRITATGAYAELKNKISSSDPSSFTFDYTVSTVLEDQRDLLFAYNKESRQWKQTGTTPDPRAWVWNDGTNNSFDVNFYHALAAVKFELNTSTAGANVHSITLCYMDASKNIVKEVGVARYGECTVTGDDTSAGSCEVGFSWDPSKLDTFRPLHYEYPNTSGSTFADGYAKTGRGVMFMIPQTIPHTISTTGGDATLKIIVEFSKYGSSEYHTVVKDFTSNDVTWDAGFYYLYRLSIGEFHVPGEPLVGNASLSATGIKFTHGGVAYSEFIPVKGVEKIGLVLDRYETKDNGAADFYLYSVFDGNVPSAATYAPPTPVSFSFDFLPITLPASGAVLTTVYDFGDGADEAYSTAYHFDLFPTHTVTTKTYYVFNVNPGASTFNVAFATNSTNNSAYFKGNVLGIFVLAVKPNPDIPSNWDDFFSNLSDYL